MGIVILISEGGGAWGRVSRLAATLQLQRGGKGKKAHIGGRGNIGFLHLSCWIEGGMNNVGRKESDG